jgi:SAM-dependent methyltransferase
MTFSKEIVTDEVAIAHAPLSGANPITPSADGSEKRKNIVGLLRGYFATPIIATLGETGMADKMLEGDFSANDWPSTLDSETIAALFRYLFSIGLLMRGTAGDYALSADGRSALKRNGAFSLLMSYAPYFQELSRTIVGHDADPKVDRLRNVRGSGQLHSRKFFPEAFTLFSDMAPTAVIDVGCGDGCFLCHALEKWPELRIFGVDLSPTAVEATKKRLDSLCSFDPVAVNADGLDVQLWSVAAREAIPETQRLVISFWFVAHEFSRISQNRLVDFFTAVRSAFPRAQILLGEITRIRPETLAQDHDLSIMPEFLLFHELSGQGVITWEAWQDVLRKIPYKLKAEKKFDEVHVSRGASIPASFIWRLDPQ